MFTAEEPLVWRKSSRTGNGSNCVEVAFAQEAVLARDSKDLGGPHLGFGPAQWSAFLRTVRSGDTDLP